MPRRPQLSERLATEGKGREAFNAGGGGVASPPAVKKETEGKERWEDTHQRVTFYCSVALREAIEEEMRRSGRSKSQVIADAVREGLGVQG